MPLLQPDAELIVDETGRRCRLGLVTRDKENRFWGITARHALRDRSEARIQDADRRTIGRFAEADNKFRFARNESAYQLIRFALEPEALRADRVAFGVTWPRYAAEDDALLGTTIVSIEAGQRQIGTVVEVNSVASIAFTGAEPSLVLGALLVALDDPSIVRPGQAGTLLLSEAGEAVGLGIATQTAGAHLELIAAPLTTYLQRTGLRPWAPSGAHWTDLTHRARSFLREARADEGPDLGRAPQLDRGDE